MTVAGFGFTAPFMKSVSRGAARAFALMPASQGVMHWPARGPNASALVEPHSWPLQASAIDRLLLAHGLENAIQPDLLLDECWRVLTPEGRVIVLAPNRSGLWARRDGTPFGHGRPYSMNQLSTQMAQHGLDVVRSAGALYTPPSESRFWTRAGPVVERAGRRLDAQRLAGVLIVEAIKRIPAPRRGSKVSAFKPLPAIGAFAGAAPEPTQRKK
jgi:SAM-dependent methyltransferase